MTDEKSSDPAMKRKNKDGFTNILSEEIIIAVSEILKDHLGDISEIDISLGILNSREIQKMILSDTSVQLNSKLGFALISSVSNSARRFKMIHQRMNDSTYKKLIEPVIRELRQSGRDFTHTPSHYSSAFPGLALLGKCFMVSRKIFDLVAVSPEEDQKEAEKHSLLEKYKTGTEGEILLSPDIEKELKADAKLISGMPFTVMWSSFGGIYMEDSLQDKHEEFYTDFYDNVVSGTNYSASWYSLQASDMHPFYMSDITYDRNVVKNVNLKEVKNEKLTEAMLNTMLEQSLSIMVGFKVKFSKTESLSFTQWTQI